MYTIYLKFYLLLSLLLCSLISCSNVRETNAKKIWEEIPGTSIIELGSINSLIATRTNIIAVAENGIIVIDGTKGSAESFELLNTGSNQNLLLSAGELESFWLSEKNAVLGFNHKGELSERLSIDYPFEIRDLVLWQDLLLTLTADGSVFELNKSLTSNTKILEATEEEHLTSRCLAVDHAKKYWRVSSEQITVFSKNSSTGKVFEPSMVTNVDMLPSPGLLLCDQLIVMQNGDLMLSLSGMVFRYNLEIDSWIRIVELPKHLIGGSTASYTLFEDSKNNLWVGGLSGLYIFSPNYKMVGHFPSEEFFDNYWVSSIIEDTQNQMWVSTMSRVYVSQPNLEFE